MKSHFVCYCMYISTVELHDKYSMSLAAGDECVPVSPYSRDEVLEYSIPYCIMYLKERNECNIWKYSHFHCGRGPA